MAGFSDVQYLMRIGEVTFPDINNNIDDSTAGAPPSILDKSLYPRRQSSSSINGLTLRISPNLVAGNTIVLMPLGNTVDVCADNVGNGFALVKYGSLPGYCTRSYLLQTPGEVQVLYNIRADGVSRQVVETILPLSSAQMYPFK